MREKDLYVRNAKTPAPDHMTNYLTHHLTHNLTHHPTCHIPGGILLNPPTLQGSLISPILYLFYNADLLGICERPGITTSALCFVDDINVLACGKSTEENCKTLEVIKKYEKWASRHGSVFAPKKYELIHLSRNSKKFNMFTVIQIGNNIIKPKTDIRILGLQIDSN